MTGYCVHCGKPVKEENKFCTNCGKSIHFKNPQAEDKTQDVIPEESQEKINETKSNEEFVKRMEQKVKESVIIHLRKDYLDLMNIPSWSRGILFQLSVYLSDGIPPPMIPIKYINNVLRIVSKYTNYIGETDVIESIVAEKGERVSSGHTILPWDRGLYIATFAVRKGKVQPHEQVIGHLFYMKKPESLLIGVLSDNAFYFNHMTERDIQQYIIQELKLLMKPKLWKSVLILMGQELTETERMGAELSARTNEIMGNFADKMKKLSKNPKND